jgi:hypothetical protein
MRRERFRKLGVWSEGSGSFGLAATPLMSSTVPSAGPPGPSR